MNNNFNQKIHKKEKYLLILSLTLLAVIPLIFNNANADTLGNSYENYPNYPIHVMYDDDNVINGKTFNQLKSIYNSNDTNNEPVRNQLKSQINNSFTVLHIYNNGDGSLNININNDSSKPQNSLNTKINYVIEPMSMDGQIDVNSFKSLNGTLDLNNFDNDFKNLINKKIPDGYRLNNKLPPAPIDIVSQDKVNYTIGTTINVVKDNNNQNSQSNQYDSNDSAVINTLSNNPKVKDITLNEQEDGDYKVINAKDLHNHDLMNNIKNINLQSGYSSDSSNPVHSIDFTDNDSVTEALSYVNKSDPYGPYGPNDSIVINTLSNSPKVKDITLNEQDHGNYKVINAKDLHNGDLLNNIKQINLQPGYSNNPIHSIDFAYDGSVTDALNNSSQFNNTFSGNYVVPFNNSKNSNDSSSDFNNSTPNNTNDSNQFTFPAVPTTPKTNDYKSSNNNASSHKITEIYAKQLKQDKANVKKNQKQLNNIKKELKVTKSKSHKAKLNKELKQAKNAFIKSEVKLNHAKHAVK